MIIKPATKTLIKSVLINRPLSLGKTLRALSFLKAATGFKKWASRKSGNTANRIVVIKNKKGLLYFFCGRERKMKMTEAVKKARQPSRMKPKTINAKIAGASLKNCPLIPTP